MYHTLLVPLDGSAYSERALPMAMSMARHLNRQVDLVVPRCRHKVSQPANNAATQLLAMCATVGGQIDELSR
jgi:nucleotide-binding universal stress UspA family protein